MAGKQPATAATAGRVPAVRPTRPSRRLRPSGGAAADGARPSAVPASRAPDSIVRVQRNLEVGTASDPCEREADAAASAVVSALRGRHATPAVMAVPAGRHIRRAPAPGPGEDTVDAATEARILSARAGGTPLESGTRQSMEQAFGADFGAVRLHGGPEASRLSRQIGATAFTLGSDIFFRRTPPDMSSEAGRYLLAHELAHTVQQGTSAGLARGGSPAATPGVVQRKVGFEFETGIPVRALDPGFVPLDYQEKVFAATSGKWKVVADSSNMEFVTEPFEETDEGQRTLLKTMTELVFWAGEIPDEVQRAASAKSKAGGRVAQVDPSLGKAGSRGLFGQIPFVIPVGKLADAQIKASPQATGGVTLDQIPALVDAMLKTTVSADEPRKLGTMLGKGVAIPDEEHDTKTLARKAELLAYQRQTGVSPQDFASSLVAMNLLHAQLLASAKDMAVQAVNSHVAGLSSRGPVPDFGKLKGLLTLVISYLLVGEHEPEAMEYAKIIAPLMARTNFHVMFRLLDPHEKDLFTEAFVLQAAGLAGTGGKPVFARGFKHGDKVEHGPARSAWIDSIRHGSPHEIFGGHWRNPADLLSQGSGSIAAANSASLGNMDAPDRRASGQRDLAVLELRRLPQDVQRTEWTRLALLVFDVIRQVRGV
jgi:uncharacterized protein DUF4157